MVIALHKPAAAPMLDEPTLRGRVACVDLETTGGAAGFQRVIEVGVVLLDDGRVVDEWSSLLNPGCRIPRAITAITGIDDAMVADAPRFSDLAAEILRRLDGRLFVAHNAGFDYGFLRRELRRIGVRFGAPRLCTVQLSRALFPQEHCHSLDALIERHALACDARHRALGDARVLPALLDAFEACAGRARLDEAVAAQIRARRLPAGLPVELADDLPERPGVYVLRGEAGVPLYVGMGRSLRSRVLAHFAARGRDGHVVDEVRDIEWFETGGEFGALLLEARLIRELSPRTHRRLRASADACVIRLRDAGAGTMVAVETAAGSGLDGGDECYGPFVSESAARRALEGRARDAGLCLRLIGLESGEGSCFARQLGRCRGACLGVEPRALHDARLKLALAPLRLRSWPFPGAIAIREPAAGAAGSVLHVINRWRHLGSAASEAELQSLDGACNDAGFDADMYRIVSRWLRRADARACMALPARGTGA